MAEIAEVGPIKEWLVDTLPYEVFWANRDGNIIYGNQILCDRLQYKKSELTKLSIFDINSTVTSESWRAHWEKVRKNGSDNFKAVHRNRSGKFYEVEVYAQFFSYGGEQMICAILKDISSSSFYKNLIDNVESIAKVGGWNLDLQDGTILVTKEALSIFKTENKEDFHPNKIIHYLKDADLFKKSIVKATRNAVPFDEVFETKENPSRFIRAIVKPVLKGDKIFKIVGVYQDVTEGKERDVQLHRALEEIKSLKDKLEIENEYLQEEISAKINADNIICKSEVYAKVLEQVHLVAPTATTVLITGESGTGKELLASALHTNSLRKERPLIKVNCATLPKELIESELFGHKKGAFTGAVDDKVGKFTLADGGTIFLDEIGELPIDLQSKLLRVLQDGEFDELGGTKTIKVDVRVIAATNRRLEKMIKEGTFREDLYYRLNVFPIYNIPLRDRKEDIPLLAQFFLEKYSAKAGKSFRRLSKKTVNALMAYSFPGNIRELENLIERAVIVESGTTLNIGSWMPTESESESIRTGGLLTFEEAQRQHIIRALKQTDGKVSGIGGAAGILDMNAKTLFARIKKLGIEKETVFNS
ncbi:sigma 54-interacting transcriptional regulator [Pricia sp. S334]|uniref:Sigma 54-interacting transcriptional regulator n=1 Tax=Pricia mediterranea TaxID=3076079 RepID=A0ABU3L831_9FLAO|nr:sigma 54-interacting transcriptional regulator [Pricia sp. S334]MDT7829910.1 sigma 54-interacting transcriptional regulator [Pricia sp. S334]